MSKENYFSLQHSESVVANMAATIFAAYIRNNEVNQANQDAYIKKAVEAAVKLASYTDDIVKSDSEWMPKESGSSVVL